MGFPVDIAAFRANHPEFGTSDEVSDVLVQQALDKAETQIDAGVWTTEAQEGQELTAAHILAIGPFGQDAKLVNEDGATVYSVRLEVLQKLVGRSATLVLD